MVTPGPADGMEVALIRTRTRGWAALACVLSLAPAPVALAARILPLRAASRPPLPLRRMPVPSPWRRTPARLREDGVSVAEGNVVVRTPDRTITAHRMDYDAAAALAQASGDVKVRERQVYLEGRRLRANLETGESVLEDATFVHPDSSGRGTAERIEHNPRTTVITKGTFTTCEPGSSTWMLEASALEFDREAGVGTARNARLELLGIPVVYLPWLTFPPRQRAQDRPPHAVLRDFGQRRNEPDPALLPQPRAQLRCHPPGPVHEPARRSSGRPVPIPHRTRLRVLRCGEPARGSHYRRFALTRLVPAPASARTGTRRKGRVRPGVGHPLPSGSWPGGRGGGNRPPAAGGRAHV